MCYVGITLRQLYIDNKTKEFINQTYLKALRKYNITPILISYSFNDLEKILNLCDGFILTGGGDIDPKYYNEENIASDVNKSDDILDKTIIDHAIRNTKPLLGICRGMQSINVFLGGSLNQDINNHMKVNHKITSNKDSYFGNKIPKEFYCNSYHHQSINVLANNLTVVGTSCDNTIEAIEHKSKPVIGVQFHPELNDFKENKYVFDYFINLLKVKSNLKKDDKIYPLR